MKTLSSKPVTRCQISNSNKLESLIFLGYLPPVNTLKKVGSIPNEEISFPAELLYCKKSKLAQLGCIVDKKILFPNAYPYTSSTTKILRENFANLYEDVSKIIKLDKNDLVVDVGSNDGNLLSNFKNKHKVLGVTPEKIGKLAIKKGIPTIIDYFNNKIETNGFEYDAEKKKFKSEDLRIIDKDLNEYITKNSLVDLNNRQIAAKDIEMYFSKKANFGENARLKGNYMISEDEHTDTSYGTTGYIWIYGADRQTSNNTSTNMYAFGEGFAQNYGNTANFYVYQTRCLIGSGSDPLNGIEFSGNSNITGGTFTVYGLIA